jgi:hypothetical protein
MSLMDINNRVVDEVQRHCQSKGYSEGQGVNNFVPHDCVAAFQMARFLVGQESFDHIIAIAPEGHIYGYFFEILETQVFSIFTDPPPATTVKVTEDLSRICGGKILLIEDDVISGSTLRLVLAAVGKYGPRSLSLYLGHAKCFQRLQNVPSEFANIYVAEDCLKPRDRQRHEDEFEKFFRMRFRRSSRGTSGEG